MTDQEFEHLLGEVLDELPQKYLSALDNVAIVYEDEPTPEQRRQLSLRCDQTLFGLYQGVPLPQRGAGYSLVLPDKITIFKQPLLRAHVAFEPLKAAVKHTLWHEMAHHFGLDHTRIHELEDKNKP